jgi:hypothetical protein
MSDKFTYSVSENNIHLEYSFKVPKEDFERELTTMREQHPESKVWNRTIKSLMMEWAVHNALHAFGFLRNRTSHTDLNWPQAWIFRVGYAIFGKLVWPFIK